MTGLSARSVRDSALLEEAPAPLPADAERVRLPLPLAALPSRQLKPAAKLLLVVLHDRVSYFQRSGGECFFAVGTLAAMFGVTPRGLQKTLLALRQLGLVEVEERAGRTSLYRTTALAQQWMLGTKAPTASRNTPPRKRKIVHPSAADTLKRKIVHPSTGKPFTPHPPKSGKSFTQDRVLVRDLESSPPTPQATDLLPSSLLGELEQRMGVDNSVLQALAALPWPKRCAVSERIARFSEPVRHPLRAIASTVEKVELLLATGEDLPVRHDPPHYDPWTHGRPLEKRNLPLWQLRERFPEADDQSAALALRDDADRRDALVDQLRRQDGEATRNNLSEDACREAWGYVPALRLESLGQAPAAASLAQAEAVLAQLRAPSRPTPSAPRPHRLAKTSPELPAARSAES